MYLLQKDFQKESQGWVQCGSDGRESACNAGDPALISGSSPLEKKWWHTPVFLSVEFHREELVDFSSLRCKGWTWLRTATFVSFSPYADFCSFHLFPFVCLPIFLSCLSFLFHPPYLNCTLKLLSGRAHYFLYLFLSIMHYAYSCLSRLQGTWTLPDACLYLQNLAWSWHKEVLRRCLLRESFVGIRLSVLSFIYWLNFKQSLDHGSWSVNIVEGPREAERNACELAYAVRCWVEGVVLRSIWEIIYPHLSYNNGTHSYSLSFRA